MQEDLIEKLKSGDQQAFETFVTDFQQRVYRTAYKIIGDKDLADDAAQEVFIKVYHAIGKFKGDSKLSTWVYRITMNVCIDFKRKLGKQHTVPLITQTEDGEKTLEIEGLTNVPHNEYDKAETKEAIKKGIMQLKEKHRAVLVLREIEGLSYGEISEILKCSEGTMKSRLNRAREALREILKKDGYFL